MDPASDPNTRNPWSLTSISPAPTKPIGFNQVALHRIFALVLSERTDSDPINIPITDHHDDDCGAPVVPEPGCLLHVLVTCKGLHIG
jgi:hypothetical protein